MAFRYDYQVQVLTQNLTECLSRNSNIVSIREASVLTVVTLGGVSNLDRLATQRNDMRKIFGSLFGNSQQGRNERSAVQWVNSLRGSDSYLLVHGANNQSAKISLGNSKFPKQHINYVGVAGVVTFGLTLISVTGTPIAAASLAAPSAAKISISKILAAIV